MQEEKVSIIVPVYNSGQFLKECVQSIINQTYKNIEVILIDDGSTDGSGEICDLVSKSDMRVKTIHQTNQGVSHSRNMGIEIATGKYLCFVDSDDTLHSQFIEILHQGFDSDIDMTVCSFNLCKSGDSFLLQGRDDNVSNLHSMLFDQEESIATMLYGKIFAGHCCNKMFRKNALKDIRFNKDIYVYEDALFVLQYLLRSRKTKFIDIGLYNYFFRNESATHGLMSDKKMTAFDALDIAKQLLNERYDEKFDTLISYTKAKWVLFFYRILAFDKDNRKKYSSVLKSKATECKVNRYYTFKMKLKFFLIGINPKLYYLFVDK